MPAALTDRARTRPESEGEENTGTICGLFPKSTNALKTVSRKRTRQRLIENRKCEEVRYLKGYLFSIGFAFDASVQGVWVG